MYDNNIGKKIFFRLKGRINQLYYAVNDEDPEDVPQSIVEEYKFGEISSTQYDNLIGEMLELVYSL